MGLRRRRHVALVSQETPTSVGTRTQNEETPGLWKPPLEIGRQQDNGDEGFHRRAKQAIVKINGPFVQTYLGVHMYA